MRMLRLTVLLASGVALTAPALAARAQVTTTTSNGDVVVYNQKNVVDHLITGDSLEIQSAQLAAMRSQNAAVKSFATMLVTDHTKHLENLRKLAGKRDIGRELNAADNSATAGARMLTRLNAMPADSGFDRAFIRQQVRHHQRALDELATLRPAAKDDVLQQDIDATRPVLEKHLAQAKIVAAQLGIPADSLAMPMRRPR
ncbi:MAG: DUF4142 domain-containing protein [Gemmatimonadales bacterium]